MKVRYFVKIIGVFIILFLSNCTVKPVQSKENFKIKVDTLVYFDELRERKIPVAIYHPENPKNDNNIPIIFSHGWGENAGGDYSRYSYLTEYLASKGYFVASIQHELSTDEMLPMQGDFKITRRPNWERGVQNISYVLNKIKKDFPKYNYDKLALIGHSNGGDMTVLFAHKYPKLVKRIISMDNRRMPFPRTAKPKIFTLRSNDYPADAGVLPNEIEIKRYDIEISYTNINHGNMDNDATIEERKFITEKILEFLKK